MPSIAKPIATHPTLQRNALGLTIRDYEGSMSTLCAGCGHDSITAAVIRALWELDTQPHMVAKLSGIGCSSKTPTYFVSGAHGFNSAHGRMPAIATGAAAANRDLLYIGVSGDGDSLSIGLGQLCHAIRRNVRMAYILENNGVYGLTKGQFSASSDVGSKSKRGEANRMAPIDPVRLALSLGATFVARSFSGDKEQLVPILKAALTLRPELAAKLPPALTARVADLNDLPAGEITARDLPEPLLITATMAIDIRIDAIASAASSNESGGRVGRSGGMAGDAILVWELCRRRCSLVVLNRDRNCS